MTATVQCPQCAQKEGQIKDGYTAAGSQRYRCKLCKYRYTPQPKERGYDEEIRLQALQLFLEGATLRQISRILEVNHQSVANWVNGYTNYLPPNLPESILEQAMLDGIFPWKPPKSPPKKK